MGSKNEAYRDTQEDVPKDDALQPLFDARLDFEELDGGEVPPSLKETFADNGVPLQEKKLSVSILKVGYEWRIEAGGTRYVVRNDTDALNIYKETRLPWIPKVLHECRVAGALGMERRDLVPTFTEHVSWMFDYLLSPGREQAESSHHIKILRVVAHYIQIYSNQCIETGVPWSGNLDELPSRWNHPMIMKAFQSALKQARTSFDDVTDDLASANRGVQVATALVKNLEENLALQPSPEEKSPVEACLTTAREGLTMAQRHFDIVDQRVKDFDIWGQWNGHDEDWFRRKLGDILDQLGSILLTRSTWGRIRYQEALHQQAD